MREDLVLNSLAMLSMHGQKIGQYDPAVFPIFLSIPPALLERGFAPSVEQMHAMLIFQYRIQWPLSKLEVGSYCASSIFMPSAINLHDWVPADDLSSSKSSRCI